MLGAFLTIICSHQTSQSKDDFAACELAEYSLDAENPDSDDTNEGLAIISSTGFYEFRTQFFATVINQISGNSFVPVFSVSRIILYLQLQLHHC